MEDIRIKICFIISGLSVGGAEEMLFKLLKNMNREKFDTSVICLTAQGDYVSKIENLSIPVYIIDLKKNIVDFSKFFYLIKLIKKLQPDIVHTWMYHADFLGGVASKLSGIKNIIWSIRQSNFSTEYSNKITLIIVYLCCILSKIIPKKIISCSAIAKSIHINLGYDEKKIVVIPNGFDLERFKPDPTSPFRVRKELSLSNDCLLVGLVARYDRQKNHFGFINSAKKVYEKFPQAKFLMVGRGVDDSNAELNEVISNNKLSNCVFLLGERNDIADLMSSLDLLVSSSSYGEGFPNVIGEAMACATPCVVTDVGDSAEIVGDPRLVVIPNDEDELSEKIISILSLNHSQRDKIGKIARTRIIENFEIRKITKLYEITYTDLMEAE